MYLTIFYHRINAIGVLRVAFNFCLLRPLIAAGLRIALAGRTGTARFIHSFMTSRQSGGSMAAPAILAKGSHEGMLILDGANTVADVAVAVGAEIHVAVAIEVEEVDAVGKRCR